MELPQVVHGVVPGGIDVRTVLFIAAHVGAAIVLSVPVNRFGDGLRLGMRTAEAARYAMFIK